MRNKLVEKSQAYHILIHVLLGILCAVTVSKYHIRENVLALILIGSFGSLAPDLDHIIYYFTYGKDSEYSRIIKMFVKDRDFGNIKNFLRDNHKQLTGLYTHTLLSFFLSTLLTLVFFRRGSIYLGTLFLSIAIHFSYDIMEDLLFFKRLNPNWFMKFNKVNKNSNGIKLPYRIFFKDKKQR